MINNNALAPRQVAPKDYVPPAPVNTKPGELSLPPLPTPPNEAYGPSPILRSTLPGLLTEPDSLRQAYGRGTLTKRFWPLSNA